MIVEDIVAQVVKTIQDTDFTDVDILSFINKGCGEIATVIPLPDLMKFGNVTCASGEFQSAMPSDYHAHLLHVINTSTGKPVKKLYKSIADFLEKHPALDEVGDVQSVVVHGSKMFFQGRPTSDQILNVFYSSAPATLKLRDEPKFIPKHLHYDLLYNFCCAEAFNLIEDGIDGTKVNANKFTSRFQLATIKLETHVGLPPEKPKYVEDDEDPESFI